ncbi:hypothetical protein DL764_006045 [Monosporascus ibericus]|uniref:Uncharacterized protein n=1 Tax=Monosporascus ibericus TaxID=155417 RepID=A0A4Q4T950_9PEZI|nr:hypothetical protein DL764_006045 [Monosporascus ibericus]
MATRKDGQLLTHADFEVAVKDLIALNKSLKSKEIPTPGFLSLGQHEAALSELLRGCISVAEILIEALESLKPKAHERAQRKTTPWMTFFLALKTFWKAEYIQELNSRLETYRNQAVLRTVVCVNEKLDLYAAEQTKATKDTKAEIVEILSLNQHKLVQTLKGESSQLQRRLDTNNNLARHGREDILAAILTLSNGETRVLSSRKDGAVLDRQNSGAPKSVFWMTVSRKKQPRWPPDSEDAGEENEDSSKREDHIQSSLSFEDFSGYESLVLNCLHFRHLMDRYDMISDNHIETFDWIFCDPLEHNKKWSDFSNWLAGPEPCYWINGKAASGKSTLMKYIHQHQKTHHLLCQWSGAMELSCPAFFFWHLGTDLQRSQVGLLRSLLYDVLQNHPWLVLHTMPDICREILKSPGKALEPPTRPELLRWFRNLVQHARGKLRLCFVIDGLDEYWGDYSDLIELIQSTTSPDVKFLVSSRPITACTEAFEGIPSLRLQDLTKEDIRRYIQHHLDTKLRGKGDEYLQLVESLIEKSSGVFLWVVLVVKSLLEGIRNGDRFEELVERTDQLPPELKPLFMHILRRVPSRYRKQSFRLLHMALASLPVESHHRGHPILAIQLSFAEESWAYTKVAKIGAMSRDEERQKCKQFEARIRSRCCGLLEFQEVKYQHHRRIRSIARPAVQFIHKTAVEFLVEDNDPQTTWASDQDTTFDPYPALFQSCLLMAKNYPTETVETGGPSNKDSALLWNSLNAALDYASRAQEKRLPLPMEYLDELDKVFVSLWGSVQTFVANGTKVLPPPVEWSLAALCGYYPSDQRDTLSLFSASVAQSHPPSAEGRKFQNIQLVALHQRLVSYLHDKLALEAEDERKVQAGKLFQLMNLLVRKRPVHPVVDGAACVEMLLQNGADPMSPDLNSSLTVWARFLDALFENCRKERSETMDEMVNIFEVFIRQGAPLAITWNGKSLLERVHESRRMSKWQEQIIQRLNSIITSNMSTTELWPDDVDGGSYQKRSTPKELSTPTTSYKFKSQVSCSDRNNKELESRYGPNTMGSDDLADMEARDTFGEYRAWCVDFEPGDREV